MSHHDANIANLKFFNESRERQRAEERLLSKFTVKPIAGTREHRLIEQVAAEANGTAPPLAPAPRRALPALPKKCQFLTAEAVHLAICRELGTPAEPKSSPKPAVRPATQTPMPAAASSDLIADPVHLRCALQYGDSFLAHLRRTQPAAAMAVEEDVMNLEVAADAQPTAERQSLWACLKPAARSARDCYAEALQVHKAGALAVRAGFAGSVKSVDEIFLNIYVPNTAKQFAGAAP